MNGRLILIGWWVANGAEKALVLARRFCPLGVTSRTGASDRCPDPVVADSVVAGGIGRGRFAYLVGF